MRTVLTYYSIYCNHDFSFVLSVNYLTQFENSPFLQSVQNNTGIGLCILLAPLYRFTAFCISSFENVLFTLSLLTVRLLSLGLYDNLPVKTELYSKFFIFFYVFKCFII